MAAAGTGFELRISLGPIKLHTAQGAEAVRMTDGPRRDVLQYYATPGEITSIAKHAQFADWLTNDVRAINQVVQGILIHDSWLDAYGASFNDEQRYDQNSLLMETVLDRAVEMDDRSLSIPRTPDRRVIGCCREFATLLCAFLRHKGVPARSRCGFGAYFTETNTFEDHWVCEVWDMERKRWILVDPQMDPLQQSVLSLGFSPLDLPRARFLVAGEAWRNCRAGEADPEAFGIGCDPEEFGLSTLYGLWFVRGNLMRDFASLNKVETVPLLMRLWRGLAWDSWRLVGAVDDELTDEDLALLDTIAEFTIDPDAHFGELRELFESRSDLRPSADILRYE